MVRLVDDLLDLSRISRGTIELRKERIELAQIVQQAIETSRPTIEEAGHHLTIDLPRSAIYVDADLTRMAQVFSNILNNAAKYTEPGGEIRLSVRRQSDEVVVSVKDDGIGIPEDMLPYVFNMFTQVDRNLEKSRGGLGIGLSIVKQLVGMHDGSVQCKSDGLDTGSEFVVRLPIVMSFLPSQIEEAEPAPASSRRRIAGDGRRADKSHTEHCQRRRVKSANRSCAEFFRVYESGLRLLQRTARSQARPPGRALCSLGIPALDKVAARCAVAWPAWNRSASRRQRLQLIAAAARLTAWLLRRV
jgi:two-component sensor histidine kinase